ncbi:MAG: hypothetical protein NC348_01070, partial [Clostridium sp.]|nr:hypothetical protein [Clostridium sp.]
EECNVAYGDKPHQAARRDGIEKGIKWLSLLVTTADLIKIFYKKRRDDYEKNKQRFLNGRADYRYCDYGYLSRCVGTGTD